MVRCKVIEADFVAQGQSFLGIDGFFTSCSLSCFTPRPAVRTGSMGSCASQHQFIASVLTLVCADVCFLPARALIICGMKLVIFCDAMSHARVCLLRSWSYECKHQCLSLADCLAPMRTFNICDFLDSHCLALHRLARSLNL